MRITTGLLFATIFATTLARELPDFIHVCKRNTPKLGDCIKSSVENIRPYLVTGLPEYNIPSLEPLLLNELAAAPGNTIHLRLKNLNVYGASNFSVVRIKANLDTLRVIVELDFSTLSLQGDYDVDGKVLLLRIQGSGPMYGNFSDCKGQVKLQLATTVGEDGKNYVKVVDFKTKIYVGNGKLKLENLFGGDRALGDAINGAINGNFEAFISELQPSLESAISDTFQKIANGILSQFTYETLFPVS